MHYFTKELIANNAKHHGSWWDQGIANWDAFVDQEAKNAEKSGFVGNAAAIIPRDAYIEFDAIARRVMRTDNGRPYMDDLLPLSRNMDIGKTVHMNLVASDISDEVVTTMSGQPAVPVDHVDYETRGNPVPIHQKGFGRSWREWRSLTSENFDALADDQEAALYKLQGRNAKYVLDGDIKQVAAGYKGYGIRTNPLSKSINLGSAAGGANIDLTSPSTTADAIINFFLQNLGKLLDDNYVFRAANVYVSPEIMRNLDRPYSGAMGFKTGSIRDAILSVAARRVAKIDSTFELTGNEFFGFVADSQFIRPLIGMATSTFAMPRLYPMDNYNFMVWNAVGLEVRADYNGRTGVFYSVDVD